MELYHLAEVADYISPFIGKDNCANIYSIVKPTRSPEDIGFSTWWEERKKEWGIPKKDGREIADD